MERDEDIEDRIRKTGLDLHAAARGTLPVFDRKHWLGRVMEWSMQNEEFKIRLFRFIDVLPSLTSDEQAVKILHEYFSGETEAPRLVSGGIAMLARTGPARAAAGRAIRKSIGSMARLFIAGSDPGSAVKALEALHADSTEFSIDLLGEVVVSDAEADVYAERYLGLIDFLGGQFSGLARPDVSIKVSSLDARIDPLDWEGSIERTKDRLRPLLRAARERNISTTFDMEHFHHKGLIIALFRSILEEEEFRERPSIGIALQAYLRDAGRDVKDLIAWARKHSRTITIRLVKGAYWDYEVVANRQRGWPVPVFFRKEETDRNFEQLTRLLFENADIIRPAIATHNLRSIANAMVIAEMLHVPHEAFEFQMLYGMAEPLRKAVLERGHGVRLYTPVGELVPGMAYLVRRLLENTSNESFLRKSFSDRTPFENLIKAPRAKDERQETAAPSGFRNEPALDFSLAVNRQMMLDAIAEVRRRLNREYPLIIDGREKRTHSEILSLNPARPEEIVGRVSSASRKEADEAVAASTRARDAWQRTAPEKRAEYLFMAAGTMRAQRADLAALEVLEVGKTWKEADGDVCEAIDYLEYYGREMVRLGRPRPLGDYPGEENEYAYRPRGIGAVIAPWNFPLAIATGMAAAALVAGNCVILKPSGLSPVTGFRLVEIFQSAGLPPGVLQFLPGPGQDVGEYLVSHPAIDFIAFTGSKEVGLRIVKLAAETQEGQRSVKKVIAEMGGKNAVIVDETADLDEAVKGIVESAFGFQGQKCSACSRVIALAGVYAELCERLRDAVASIPIGPPEDPAVLMGPVIDEAAKRKIASFIASGKEEGTVLVERTIEDTGYFVGPAVFADLKPGSRILRDEIFGPVLAVIRAEDMDQAIALANDSLYALTGGLFSRSPANIEKVKEEFRAGNLYINRTITGALVGRQPFGGFGMSGVGSKAGGPDYLLQFMNPVSISENTLRRGFAPLRRP